MRRLGILGTVATGLFVLAGYATARLPQGTWATRFGPVVALRAHAGLGLPMAMAGLALLTVAWIGLVLAVRGRRDGAAVAVGMALLWSLPLLLAPPVFSGDGWSYVATGYMTGHGISPYDVTPAVLPHVLRSGVNPRWLLVRSRYGPLPLLWGAVFSRLTANPWLLLAAYRLLSLASLALLAWALDRLARRTGRDPACVVAVVVASPFVIAHGIGGMHNDLLVAALAAAALAVTTAERWWVGAALAGAAAAVKAPGGLAIVGVVLLAIPPGATLLARVGRAGRIALVSVAVLTGSGFLGGLGVGWLPTLWRATTGERPNHLSLPGQVAVLLAPVAGHPVADAVATGLRYAGLLAVAVLLCRLFLRRRPVSVEAAVGATALTLGVVVMIAPVVHFWYLLWALPLLAALRLTERGRLAAMATVGVLGLLAWDDASFRFPRPWLEGSAMVAYGVPLLAFALAYAPRVVGEISSRRPSAQTSSAVR